MLFSASTGREALSFGSIFTESWSSRGTIGDSLLFFFQASSGDGAHISSILKGFLKEVPFLSCFLAS